jgi:hypothetical protein
MKQEDEFESSNIDLAGPKTGHIDGLSSTSHKQCDKRYIQSAHLNVYRVRKIVYPR